MTENRGPVLVAVVSHRSADQLPGLLASLPDGLRGTRWRLVVADNDSPDGSVDLVRALAPEATVVETGANLGYAAGIEACLADADPAEAVLVLNPDVRLDPGCVAALLDACADPGVGIAVPVVRRPDGSAEPTLRRRPTAVRTAIGAVLGARARWIPGAAEELAPHVDVGDWANGAVLLVPSATRRAVGPWARELFLYSEEVDYCERVRRTGRRVQRVDGAGAVHRGGEVATAPALWAQLVTNRVVHAARYNGRVDATLTWAVLLVAQALRLVLRRGTHRAALGALWRGRRTLLSGTPTNPAAAPRVRALLGAGPGVRA